MRVIPVLDLKEGRVVYARGGRRSEYRTLSSCLHGGADPLALAGAMRRRLGVNELYLADLDAIELKTRATTLYRDLADLGMDLWVDAGIRDGLEVRDLLDSGVHRVIAALETLDGPHALTECVRVAGADRVVFGLDLRGGLPFTSHDVLWPSHEPSDLIELAASTGIHRLLILDVERVGSGHGVGTEALAARAVQVHPGWEIAVGGGVSGTDDLDRLERIGISAVLVGSAVHDGRIGPESILRRGSRPGR